MRQCDAGTSENRSTPSTMLRQKRSASGDPGNKALTPTTATGGCLDTMYHLCTGQTNNIEDRPSGFAAMPSRDRSSARRDHIRTRLVSLVRMYQQLSLWKIR